MNRDIKRLTPFRDFWFLRGGPLLQLFDGSFTAVYDGEELGYDGLKLWFVEICIKCRTQLFRVLLDEESKLAKLLSSIFERESRPIVVGCPKPRVDLRRDTGPSGDIFISWVGSEGTYLVDVRIRRHGGIDLGWLNGERDFILGTPSDPRREVHVEELIQLFSVLSSGDKDTVCRYRGSIG